MNIQIKLGKYGAYTRKASSFDVFLHQLLKLCQLGGDNYIFIANKRCFCSPGYNLADIKMNKTAWDWGR